MRRIIVIALVNSLNCNVNSEKAGACQHEATFKYYSFVIVVTHEL